MDKGAKMIHFEWLWLGLILPLPLVVRYLLPPLLPVQQAALKVPFLEDFDTGEAPVNLRQIPWKLAIALAAWAFLVLAASRPQWLGDPIPQAVSGRDLMLAVDVSGSMQEKDFTLSGKAVDRLTATKQVAGEFIKRRQGDRIGLILFGTTAYLQTPLTFDRDTVVNLLDESFIGITDDEPATSIGDAIGLAVKRLRQNPESNRVLVLLTDGANTAGEVKPLKAAELAAEHGLKIYTIGMGAEAMVVRSVFGNQRVNPSRDLDERMLRMIAQQTGGRYFRARDTQELEQIYAIVDELEPVESDQRSFRPHTELYPWPLAVSMLLFLLLAVTGVRQK